MSGWKTAFALALFALFGFAFLDGFEAAHADEAATLTTTVDAEAAQAEAIDAEGEIERRRRGKRSACSRLARAVKQACPCNGPDGSGWAGGHDEYVECVSQTLGEKLGEEPSERATECATKILERAEASEIGTPDFECPERKQRREKPSEPGEPGGGV